MRTVSTAGIAKRAKQPTLWMPVAIIPGIAREINKSTPVRIPMSQAIACARRAKGSSRRTKTARTTGIVRRKTNTTRQMTFVPQRILIAGIARPAKRRLMSGRRVRIPGTAPFARNGMRRMQSVRAVGGIATVARKFWNGTKIATTIGGATPVTSTMPSVRTARRIKAGIVPIATNPMSQRQVVRTVGIVPII
jgi:hypothetical protein